MSENHDELWAKWAREDGTRDLRTGLRVGEVAADKPIEITPEMIESATKVLLNSGLIEHESWSGASERDLVKRMLTVALMGKICPALSAE